MATKSSKSYSSADLSKDLATAKAKTTGMNTSLINSAGTADKLARASRAGTRTGSPTQSVDASIESLPEMTPTVAPMPETPVSPAVATPAIAAPPSAQESLAAAKASGLPAPQDAGEARSQMQSFAPSKFYKPSPTSDQIYNQSGQALSYDQYVAQGGIGKPGDSAFGDVQLGLPNTSAIDQQLEADPGYQQLLQSQKEYNDVVNQRSSLTEEYSAISKKLGIDELNTELMNMKNVIEGTEDDLRTEITKAGGFATESQVQALTMARNKTLVKNYNNLLETKQMAMETLNTMIGLAAQDRQFAQQAAMQKLEIDFKIMDYKDKMKQNAQNAMNKVAEMYGYGALMTGDPWQDALTERTLGLQPGGLQQLANSMTLEEQRWQQEFGLQQDQFALQQAQFGLEQDKFAWDTSTSNPANVPDGMVVDPMTGNVVPEGSLDGTAALRTQDQINTIDKLLTHKGRTGAVGATTVNRSTGLSNLFGLLKPGGPDMSRLTGDQQDFIASTENIIKQLTLNTFQEAKAKGATFGAMTEGEWKILGGVATKLSQYRIEKDGKVIGYNAAEKDFVNELQKISNFAKYGYIRQGGNPADVGVPKQQDGSYWLNIAGKMQNVTPQTDPNTINGPFLNRAGTASSANQVKGMQQTAPRVPLIKMDSSSQKVAPLTKVFPQGSTGGQCGTWVRSVVERQGLTYPRVGDSLAEKTATAKRYGVPVNKARPGSVILTSENKTNGHVAYIIGRNAKGFIVGESNYGLNGKVSYGRVIPFNSPKILGIINPTKA